MNRKGMKAEARKVFRRHYWMIVIICLFAAMFGVGYTSSLWSINLDLSYEISSLEDPASRPSNWSDVLTSLATGDETHARKQAERNQRQIVRNDTNAMLGRKRGVLASALNSFSSGAFLISITDAVNSIVHNGGISVAAPVILSLAVIIFVTLFIQQTYIVVMNRMLLEGRIYRKIPASRFLYPIHTRKWVNMAWTMFLENLFLTLWSLTIIGGIIKRYSYFAVPYIVAENPNISGLQAIRLSKRMMKGHKWECFVAEFSFLGWYLLSLVTFGLSGIFYSNGYNAAFFAEYYAYLRTTAKAEHIDGAQMLSDDLLYVKADPHVVNEAYADVVQAIETIESELVPAPKPQGFVGFLREWLGVRILHAESVNRYEDYRESLSQLRSGKELFDGTVYPGRLAPAPMASGFHQSRAISADRSYSLVNLVMMFFIFIIAGWIWEVSLAFISEGMFVNRGTLHGPWLPIYGTGGIIILTLLKKLRSNPAMEFVASVVLCGCLEYGSSWYLEMTHDGQRWWDYTGYFLNLNGRICAEGLLTFGLGGLAIVYLLAPALDNLLDRFDRRKLAAVAAILLVLYCADQAYSMKHPNMGAGITDYKGSQTSQTS